MFQLDALTIVLMCVYINTPTSCRLAICILQSEDNQERKVDTSEVIHIKRELTSSNFVLQPSTAALCKDGYHYNLSCASNLDSLLPWMDP